MSAKRRRAPTSWSTPWQDGSPAGSGSRWTVIGRASGRNGGLRREDRFLGSFGQHHAHDLLDREDMDAGPPTVEIMAGAMPLAGVEADMVRVVVTAERERE